MKKILTAGLIMMLLFNSMPVTISAMESTTDNSSDALINEELIEIDNETLDNINTDYEIFGNEVEQKVSNLDEIYGDSILSLTTLNYIDIAKIILSAYYNVEVDDYSNITSIHLDDKILLYDANDVNTYVAYNFFLESGEKGYITIATHTNTVLIRDIVEQQLLPTNQSKIYYLSNEEIYYEESGQYKTLDGISIEKEEFIAFLNERRTAYYDLTLDLLSELRADTISQLNNLIYINVSDFQEENAGKSYKGQSGSGYGGIDDCKKYLQDRYGGTITKTSSKSLSMANFKQSDLEADASNCTLAAITRILYFYRNKYTKIDNDYTKIYKKVKKVAKKYGYTKKKGTAFTKINNIVDDVVHDYGYKKSKCSGIYVWTFDNQVKAEIDNNRPVIMNIARGYYANHTVTVCGYAKYTCTKKVLGITTKKTYNMIEVYDGWSNSKRYIDYSAFAYDLASSGFGSFNTVTMKK